MGYIELFKREGRHSFLAVVFVVPDQKGSDYVPEFLIGLLHSLYKAWQCITNFELIDMDKY